MSTLTHHTYYTRQLNARQYRVLALHCQSHNLTYSSLKSSYSMLISGLTTAQADTLIELEDALTNNTGG